MDRIICVGTLFLFVFVALFGRDRDAPNTIFVDDGESSSIASSSRTPAAQLEIGRAVGGYAFGRADFPVGLSPSSMATGDFNRDGKLDLVIANQAAGTVSVLLGQRDGTFAPKVDYTAGSAPSSVAVGDFNRDGKLDIAVATSSLNSVAVLLGNGDGTFRSAIHSEQQNAFDPGYAGSTCISMGAA